MKCPLRVSYWGESRESNCHPDCAWLVTNEGAQSFCAVAVIASRFGGMTKPVNAEMLDGDGE